MIDLDKHYRYSFKGIKLDPYRIFKTYGITDPVQQHVAKKALRAGEGGKSLIQDIDEIILSCERWKEMIAEDEETAKTDFYTGSKWTGEEVAAVMKTDQCSLDHGDFG